AEKQKRWGWEYIQARLFRVSIKGLVLEQTQTIGSSVINELKNWVICKHRRVIGIFCLLFLS
ncbi:hypothetical protein, partial [Flavobacterium collinsii]|uniref:hypothetical protein n=1 Tax=Flavobacterium collinsii TaxID=1114861 RepID=UPI0024901082